MEEPIVNRVAQSPLLTLDLDELIDLNSMVIIDLKNILFQGLILREKDFREFVKEHNWNQYTGKSVGIICSEEAIIPSWAYMIIASKLSGIAKMVVAGGEDAVQKGIIDEAISKLNSAELKDKKVVIKGCGSLSLRDYAYTSITSKLVQHVDSLMYGEPCSTVPVYKKPKSSV